MTDPPQARAAGFPTTRWSRISRAGDPADPESRASLERLCRDYWGPLHAHARRRGLTSDDAADLVQGLLADLIERGDLAGADPDRGRFRAFLRSACDHHLAHVRERDRALKRGGGRPPIALDRLGAGGPSDREPSHDRTADRLFERGWALTLLALVLDRLGAEMAASGKAALFERLRPTLEGGGAPYREIGRNLELSEGAVKVAAHRLRLRYRAILRDEVGRTVADPAEIDAEIAELLAALAV